MHYNGYSILPIQCADSHDATYSFWKLILKSFKKTLKAPICIPIILTSTNVLEDKHIDEKIPVWAIKQQSCKRKKSPCCKVSDDKTTISEPDLALTAKDNDVELPAIPEFMLAQNKEAYWKQMKQWMGGLICHFTVIRNGLLARWWPLNGSIHKLTPINLSAYTTLGTLL